MISLQTFRRLYSSANVANKVKFDALSLLKNPKLVQQVQQEPKPQKPPQESPAVTAISTGNKKKDNMNKNNMNMNKSVNRKKATAPQMGKQVTIPTTHPTEIINSEEKEAAKRDYTQLSEPLQVKLKEIGASLQRNERSFMERLVDTVSKNPSMSMGAKMKAFNVAADFFLNRPFDNRVRVLGGRQQAKAMPAMFKKPVAGSSMSAQSQNRKKKRK